MKLSAAERHDSLRADRHSDLYFYNSDFEHGKAAWKLHEELQVPQVFGEASAASLRPCYSE